MDDITSAFTAYTSQYTVYSQPYVRTDREVHQNKRKSISWWQILEQNYKNIKKYVRLEIHYRYHPQGSRTIHEYIQYI
jgi:murein L,D-transpeptidase YafK